MEFVLQSGHDPCVQNLLWSIRRRNPPCNAEDNLHTGLIDIEAWFGGYRGSPGLGGPQTAGLYTLAGLLDYEDTKIEDFIPCPDGTLLCVEDKLHDPDIIFPL